MLFLFFCYSKNVKMRGGKARSLAEADLSQLDAELLVLLSEVEQQSVGDGQLLGGLSAQIEHGAVPHVVLQGLREPIKNEG